ncbi:MAG: mismatch-specific DNA-glycosylase [Patescibacteria group bacterium]|nr:mismatch-specific DNA-glycosylase [Patescibacteria group bacterium]
MTKRMQLSEEQKEFKNMYNDLFCGGLDIIFCGMAVGKKSFKEKSFYANHGNKFWRVLKEARFTPTRLKPQEYKELLKYKIGLTDLTKDQCGADNGIQVTKWHRLALRNEINKYQPAILAFNGKKPAKEFLNKQKINYGEQEEVIGSTKIYVLPSTSQMANRYWEPKCWRQLLKETRRKIKHQ